VIIGVDVAPRKENNMHKNSNEYKDITEQIKRLELRCGTEKAQFAYLVAGGMRKTPAFIRVFGYNDAIQTNRVMRETDELQLLLRKETEAKIYKGFRMDKESRLEHLLTTALEAHHKYLVTNEAAHGAVYAKLMTIINSMTGDNAPTEIKHKVEITTTQLQNMSESERTEAYKRMMTGKLQLIEDGSDSECALTDTALDGEYLPVRDRGDSLEEP